jgi:hypothetical protein
MAITVTDGGNDFATAVEAFVQTPIRIVTHQRDLIGATDAGVSRHHNFSIALNSNALTLVNTTVVNISTGEAGLNRNNERNARAPGEKAEYLNFGSCGTTLSRDCLFFLSFVYRA